MKDLDILLVDDEVRFLQTTRRLLIKQGYSVLTAAGGPEALELLEHCPARVVVLDVRMPGINGLQLLKTIKREYPHIEVIMLTGHATVHAAVEGLKAGAADYLMKPMDIQVLTMKIDELIEHKDLATRNISTMQVQ